jgi:hypothetical protein
VSIKIDLIKNSVDRIYGFGETVADDGTFTNDPIVAYHDTYFPPERKHLFAEK